MSGAVCNGVSPGCTCLSSALGQLNLTHHLAAVHPSVRMRMKLEKAHSVGPAGGSVSLVSGQEGERVHRGKRGGHI